MIIKYNVSIGLFLLILLYLYNLSVCMPQICDWLMTLFSRTIFHLSIYLYFSRYYDYTSITIYILAKRAISCYCLWTNALQCNVQLSLSRWFSQSAYQDVRSCIERSEKKTREWMYLTDIDAIQTSTRYFSTFWYVCVPRLVCCFSVVLVSVQLVSWMCCCIIFLLLWWW